MSDREFTWKHMMRPPEMLQANVEGTAQSYLFECVGTCEGDRVWVPERPGHIGWDLIEEINEHHGIYVENIREARDLDEFVEVYYQHTFESDKNYELRTQERYA